MEWYEILALAIAGLTLAYVGISLLKKRRYQKIIEKVITKFQTNMEVIEYHLFQPNDIYQIEFMNDKQYLLKLVDMSPGHEVVITNADNVVINKDIASWHRSTKPNFVSGMKEFIKIAEKEKPLIKIFLIYPSCYHITKYTNEHDCHLVAKDELVDGIYFVKYQDLKEFLAKH